MPTLFDPICLGSKTAKNRLVIPPMLTMRRELGGVATPEHASYYAERAADGPGTIIVECTAVDENVRNSPGELGLYEEAHIEPMARIAQGIRQYGALALVQLHHGGRATDAQVCESPLAPSAEILPDGRVTRAMTTEQVKEAVGQFAQAARRAQQAGFDGVELHGCHGYLINQFTSPITNLRTDEYGGSTVTQRLRFAREVIQAVREVVSEDFIVGFRMGFNDPDTQAGLTIAGELAPLVDYLHVSSGIGPGLVAVPEGYAYKWFVYAAHLVRQAVSVPVIAVNGLHTLKSAEQVILDEQADMAAVGRPYLLNPDWLRAQLGSRTVLRCLQCRSGCRYLRGGCPFRTGR